MTTDFTTQYFETLKRVYIEILQWIRDNCKPPPHKHGPGTKEWPVFILGPSDANIVIDLEHIWEKIAGNESARGCIWNGYSHAKT